MTKVCGTHTISSLDLTVHIKGEFQDFKRVVWPYRVLKAVFNVERGFSAGPSFEKQINFDAK